MVTMCCPEKQTKTGNRFLFMGKDERLLNFVTGCLSESFQLAASVQDYAELKRALKEYPDLIILDIEPPAMNGIDTALRLRRWCDVPVMLLTCWKTENNHFRGLDAYCPDYLTEPLGKETLMKWIASALPLYRGDF